MASGSPVYGFSLFGCAGSPAVAIPNVLRSNPRASETPSHRWPFTIVPLLFLSRQWSAVQPWSSWYPGGTSVTMPSSTLALVAWSLPSCTSIRDLSYHQRHAILLEDRPNGSGIFLEDFLPADKPTLDNRQCALVPRVQAVMVGTEMVIQSSDPFLHTTRGRFPDFKQAFNLVFPKNTPAKE
jgi:hypothetical protein